MPGFVSLVLGIVSWVLGFVFWLLGIVIAKVSLKCFTNFSHRFFLVGAVTNLNPGSS